MSKGLVKEYIDIINDIGDKEFEKNLEKDLLGYKIIFNEEVDSVLDDSELEGLKVSGGNRN